MTTSSAARPQMGLAGHQSICSKNTNRDIFICEELPSARSSTRGRRWGRCQRTSSGGAKGKLRAAVVSHDLRGTSGETACRTRNAATGPQVRRDISSAKFGGRPQPAESRTTRSHARPTDNAAERSARRPHRQTNAPLAKPQAGRRARGSGLSRRPAKTSEPRAQRGQPCKSATSGGACRRQCALIWGCALFYERAPRQAASSGNASLRSARSPSR